MAQFLDRSRALEVTVITSEAKQSRGISEIASSLRFSQETKPVRDGS